MKFKYFLFLLPLCFIESFSFAQNNSMLYFDDCDVKGSTTIYDYKNKKWFFTDSLDAQEQTLPASTFKILNSLIALDSKVIANEIEALQWDGTIHEFGGTPMPSWNKDTNLKEAYKNSTIWFYVNIAEKVGCRKYRRIFKKIGYGNNNLSEQGTDFWNYGNFGVSPVNQINFLVKLHESHLPFSQESIDKVKNIMISETDQLGVFRDKTGWAIKDGQNIGWWIGYLTTNDNVYFFATRIIQDVAIKNTNFSGCRKSITKKILTDIIGQ